MRAAIRTSDSGPQRIVRWVRCAAGMRLIFLTRTSEPVLLTNVANQDARAGSRRDRNGLAHRWPSSEFQSAWYRSSECKTTRLGSVELLSSSARFGQVRVIETLGFRNLD